MIRVINMTVENGCQHECLSVEIPSGGLVSVAGPNGSGKTNALRLLMYGLTGLVDRSWGSQQNLNRRGTTGGFVLLHLKDTVENLDIYVKRFFSTGAKYGDAVWLNSPDGDPVYKGRQMVDSYLEALYGVPVRLMFQLLWVRQGDICWLLDSTSTEADKFFKDLFDLSIIAKMKDDLYQVASSVVQYPDNSQQIEQYKTQVESVKASLHQLEAQHPVYEKALENADLSLADLQASTKGCVPAATKEAAVIRAKQSLAQAQAALHGVEVKLQELQGTTPPDELSQEELSILAVYDQQELSIPVYRNTDELSRQAYSQATNAKAYAEQSLATVNGQLELSLRAVSDHKNDQVCCICGTPVSGDHQHYDEGVLKVLGNPTFVQKLQKDRDDAQIKLQTCEAAVLTAYQKLCEDNQKLIALAAKQDSMKAAVQDLKVRKIALQAYQAARTSIQTYTTALNQAKVTEVSALAELEKAQALAVTSEDVGLRIQQAEQLVKDARNNVTTSVANITKCKSFIESAAQWLVQAEAAEVVRKTQTTWYDRVMLWREACQNDRIPARFLRSKIERLNSEIAVFCRMLKLPFSVFLGIDDHMVYYTQGEFTERATQLSGGQKTIAATVVHLALIRIAAPNVGFVGMDEPSVFLDEPNRARLVNLFESIRSFMEARNTVILIPTWDEELRNCCTEEISVTEKD